MYTKTRLVAWITAAALALGHGGVVTAYSANDIIATYAGNGTVGYSGDAGPAVSAALHTPAQIAGFYDDVDAVPAALAANWQTLGFDDEKFLAAVGLSIPAGEAGRSVQEQVWSRPTCEIIQA